MCRQVMTTHPVVFKIWASSQLDLPSELQHMIRDYVKDLFFSELVCLYKHRVMVDIDRAFSRYRGYLTCRPDVITLFSFMCTTHTSHDDEEHWGFWCGRGHEVQLQAVSCRSCGDYIVTHTPIPHHLRCVCP